MSQELAQRKGRRACGLSLAALVGGRYGQATCDATTLIEGEDDGENDKASFLAELKKLAEEAAALATK
jgi:hypothetical protein